MATFYISGNFFATQEYGYDAEIEAETLEEALEIHEKELTEGKWPQVEAEKIDREFNIAGKFSVYPDEESREDWNDEETLVQDQEWEGRL
jgi:hypothetical protein